MYLCTNKSKNITQITIRLINPILRILILRPAMLTNFTQNWREHCTTLCIMADPLMYCAAYYIDHTAPHASCCPPPAVCCLDSWHNHHHRENLLIILCTCLSLRHFATPCFVKVLPQCFSSLQDRVALWCSARLMA